MKSFNPIEEQQATTTSPLNFVQIPTSPFKITRPYDLTIEQQQVISLVNQQPPSVTSPIAVQPKAQLEHSLQEREIVAAYQLDYKQQTINLKEMSSPTHHQYSHLPQMEDFHILNVVNNSNSCTNQTEVLYCFYNL